MKIQTKDNIWKELKPDKVFHIITTLIGMNTLCMATALILEIRWIEILGLAYNILTITGIALSYRKYQEGEETTNEATQSQR